MTSAPAAAPVPPHVPAALVWDESLDDFPQRFADPYLCCDAVHAGPDIVWAARGAQLGRPGWVLTRFAHLQEASADFERFTPSQNHGVSGFLGFDLPLGLSEFDPPEHDFQRALVQRWFQPGAVRALEPVIAEACAALIAAFTNEGGCEFIGEFARLLPSRIFLHVMGMPQAQLQQFLEWEIAYMRGASLEIQRGATRAIYDYFRDYLAASRKEKQDTLIGAIAAGEIGGRRMTEQEALGTCMTLYIAGLDTVKSSLGWYMRHLAQDPMLQQQLRAAPELIPAAVNEFLRAYGVTTNARRAVMDLEFHGVPMRAGDLVALPSFFGARDAREYADPHRIDLARNARHVTMGSGIHLCLGMHLAKLEMQIVLREFLLRFENIRIPEGATVPWTSRSVWSIQSLPLIWNR